jgi:hypothetical protein
MAPGIAQSRLLKFAVGALLLFAVAAAALLYRSVDSDAAGSDIPVGELQEQVRAAIPGASAEIVSVEEGRASFGRQLQLVVTPAREDVARNEADAFAYGDVAWRADMLAASLATEAPELAGYRLAPPAGMQVAVPPAALGVLQGSLPAPETASKLTSLGSVTEEEALAQMASNLDTLRNAVPPGAIASTDVSVVHIDAARDRFALSVSVGTREGDALLKQAGDVMVGLQTGLVGGLSASIEGLAIAIQEEGRPLAASWIATRAMAGTTMLAPGHELPQVQSVDVEFPNLTGGPQVQAAGIGESTELPSLPTSKRIQLSRGGRSIYSAKGRVSTPEYSSPLVPRFLPHPRPRLPVRACAVVRISFTSPAHSVKVGVQKVSPEGDSGVGVAQPIARQASDNGLVWKARLPGWRRLQDATTFRVTAAYPGGYGQYVAGLMPIAGGRCPGGTGTR